MKAALILFVVLSGCMLCNSTTAAKSVDMHTSQNSLDWAGLYEGVLPCADCPGIKTRLTLNRDGRYELSTRSLERPAAPRIVRGRFTWHAGGNAISLDAKGGGQQYAVGEGRLLLLERDGARPEPSAPNRVLTMVAARVSTDATLARTLEAHRWSLESATDGQSGQIEAVSAGSGRSFAFNFSRSRLSIQGGCNQLTGSYQITADGQLKVGGMAATTMACEAALMRADAALSELLAKPMKIELKGGAPPKLRLTTASNETLLLAGQATPEALYGAATLIFLEVAAQPVACKNPLTASTVCLQVRERHYDKQGLAVGKPGDWRPFYDRIEGFTHKAGERNVLRVKRFKRSPSSAGASSFAYVLDLIIESETVPR